MGTSGIVDNFRFPGRLQRRDVAEDRTEAKHPQLHTGLRGAFAPFLYRDGVENAIAELGMHDANYYFSPFRTVDATWEVVGSPSLSSLGNFGGDLAMGTTVRTGNGAALGMVRTIFGSHSSNSWEFTPPITIHTFCAPFSETGNGVIINIGEASAAKAGSFLFGYCVGFTYGTNNQVYFMAHDGTVSKNTPRLGGGFETNVGSGGVMSAGDRLNIIVQADSEPIEDASVRKIIINGTDHPFLISSNNIIADLTSVTRQVNIGGIGIRGGATGDYSNDLMILCVNIWDRILSADEIDLLMADPFATYRKHEDSYESDAEDRLLLLDDVRAVSLGSIISKTNKIVLAG